MKPAMRQTRESSSAHNPLGFRTAASWVVIGLSLACWAGMWWVLTG
jgi:hypothetical protein